MLHLRANDWFHSWMYVMSFDTIRNDTATIKVNSVTRKCRWRQVRKRSKYGTTRVACRLCISKFGFSIGLIQRNWRHLERSRTSKKLVLTYFGMIRRIHKAFDLTIFAEASRKRQISSQRSIYTDNNENLDALITGTRRRQRDTVFSFQHRLNIKLVSCCHGNRRIVRKKKKKKERRCDQSGNCCVTLNCHPIQTDTKHSTYNHENYKFI